MVKKVVTVGAIISILFSVNLFAEEKKITIEEMEVSLAKLGAEIADEKVKLYQRESLLYQMKLELLKKQKEAKK
jgi:hypothetical protein